MNLEDNKFNIPFHWSLSVILLTFVSLFIIIISIVLLIFANRNSNHDDFINIVLIVPFLLTIVLGVLFMPYSLVVNKGCVEIVKLSGRLKIRISDIKHIEPLVLKDISGAIRTFGSGGFFGYIGYFKNDKTGKFIMYATEINNLIIIKTNKKTYVISCSCGEMFIEEIKKNMNK